MAELEDDPFRGLDVAVCPACGERNLARARFCMECGARMAVDTGERRVVSVVFADLSGFTSYSETVDPEAVRDLADEAARGLGSIVEAYGGTVDKIIGDCVMAIFGAPVSHEDDAERAVRAALDMQRYVVEHADRFAGLELSVGVHTGEAIYAPVGPSGAYTVLGDTVNTAARLQGAADRGIVLIGEGTYRAAAEAIEAVEVEPIRAKNKREPVPAWRATGVKGERPRVARRRTPLVGRDLELNRLLERWEAVRTSRQAELLTLIGSPGLGKTRLVESFLERVSDTGAAHRGRCLDYGEGITYWPVVEIIREASGIRYDDTTETVSRKLGMLLESLGTDDLDELRTMAVAVANIVGAPTTPRGAYSAEKISRSELHWGIRRIFELLAKHRPVVLVFEDLHWAEPTLIELIQFFLSSEEAGSILLLCTSRPELKDTHPELSITAGRRRAIDLAPLEPQDAEAMLAALVGPDGVEPLRELLRGAGGNPLFLEETVRMLTDYGVLDEDGHPSGGTLEHVPVPTSLQALIGARLDRLGTPERLVASEAAIIGEVFWHGAVAHARGSDGDLAGPLGLLEQRDIIRGAPTSMIADEQEYAFAHSMMRDVAYDRVPKAKRATLHERCGDWITTTTGGDDETIEFVAYHFEQACRLARQVGRGAAAPPVLRAVDALKRAGQKAMNREGLQEAERFFARALDIVGEAYPEARAELLLRRAFALWLQGRIDDSMEAFAEVAEIAGRLGRADLRSEALLDLASTSLARGKTTDAARFLEDAEIAAPDPESRTKVQVVRAQFRASQQGDPTLAAEELREAVAKADEQGLDDLAVQARLRLGTILLNSGDLAAADAALTQAAGRAAADGSVRMQAITSTFLAFTRYFRGPREDSERMAGQTVAWLKRLSGHAYYLGQALQNLGMTATAAGDLSTAEERLREALSITQGLGGRVTAEIGRHLTEVICRQGRPADTRAIAEQVRASAPERDPASNAYATLAACFASVAEGDVAGARLGFADALLVLEELRMALELAYSRISCAWAFRQLGLPDEARRQLMLARRAATSMGADAILEDVEREERALGALL